MLSDAENRCSVCLANIGPGERRQRDHLEVSLSNEVNAVFGHNNLNAPSTPLESGAVPDYLVEKTASLPVHD
jgi:hypothetical protein